MAQTLKARAGSTLRARFSYLDKDGNPVPTEGMVAHISIRSVKTNTRIILHAEESEADGSTLQKIEDGQWRLYLSGAVTRMLPSTVAWELELVQTENPDDTTTLATGVIVTTPEQVKSGA